MKYYYKYIPIFNNFCNGYFLIPFLLHKIILNTNGRYLLKKKFEKKINKYLQIDLWLISNGKLKTAFKKKKMSV